MLLLAVDRVFARSAGATSTTEQETGEASKREDISLFPLATPLIAGPGAIDGVLLLTADAGNLVYAQLCIYGSLLTILALTCLCIITAAQIQKLLGLTGMFMIGQLFGVRLSALAVQFIFDGIRESGA